METELKRVRDTGWATHRGGALRSARAAFTLIELLTVMAILAMVFAVALPGFTGLVGGALLRGEGARVAAELARAQQLAITKNRAIEVRIYRYTDPEDPGADPTWRAMQFFQVGEDGEEPLGNLIKLDSKIVFSQLPELSSLFSLPAEPDELPGIETAVSSSSFSFFPGGSTNLPGLSDSPGGGGWHVSLVEVKDEIAGKSALEINNFYSVQVDPHNGAVRSYQP